MLRELLARRNSKLGAYAGDSRLTTVPDTNEFDVALLSSSPTTPAEQESKGQTKLPSEGPTVPTTTQPQPQRPPAQPSASTHVTTLVVANMATCRTVLRELSDHKVVGMDVEGVDLGPNGTVTLIQLADEAGNAYLFDVFQCRGLIEELRDVILQNDSVVKVVHDVRADSEGLFANYQIKLSSVFDTQVALKYYKPEFMSVGKMVACSLMRVIGAVP